MSNSRLTYQSIKRLTERVRNAERISNRIRPPPFLLGLRRGFTNGLFLSVIGFL